MSMSICRHCKKREHEHVETWCLFAPTQFVAMTYAEVDAMIVSGIDKALKRSAGNGPLLFGLMAKTEAE